MNINELATMLKKMRSSAKHGELKLQSQLFGIFYQKEIKVLGCHPLEIVRLAKLKDSVKADIYLGMKLTAHVTPLNKKAK